MRVWLKGERLIIAHRYGGCYDVVELGDTGADVTNELSELPPGAVELIPKAQREILRLNLIDRLCDKQWSGGSDQYYYELRERMHLVADVALEVLDWTNRGVVCHCPNGSKIPHERGTGGCNKTEEVP
jgi:hypothetical protein